MPADKPVRLLHDHLQTNPRRVLGNQPSELVHCHKHDQFYPKAENCPWCLSWAEEQAERAARKTDPGPGKTPGQLAYEKKWPYTPYATGWGSLSAGDRNQWEQIAGMKSDVQPETLEEDDYDTWANMMAMKIWADPRISKHVRGLGARDAVWALRSVAPHYARALGLFDRDPPADL